ncbi:MAG: MogA/MoaB family molybdenum cofactor biosynthesis protein [Cellulomonas sp.]|nr:MogA/MoaB family molybdenum cofactor biosynthesis protein [Cellulomonas sp.]
MTGHDHHQHHPSPDERPRTATVITVSDRSARGERIDASGPAAVRRLRAAGYLVDDPVVVPDGTEPVAAAIGAAVQGGARVVLTSGGTGVGPRDLTPEGTRPVLGRELPGLAEALRRHGADHNPAAVLGRGLAGTTVEGTVVVNLPGSPAAVEQSLDVLLPVLGHLLDQLDGSDH